VFKGCNVRILVTPIPFPFQPNTLLSDGGSGQVVNVSVTANVTSTGTATNTDAGVSVTVPYCTASLHTYKSVGTSAISIPRLAGRWYTRVCNSCKNTGSPMVTCTADGTTPTTALTSPGEALEVCDCVVYTDPTNDVLCISDTASTAVTAYDCR
jgi:hypothetical protein